MKSSRAFLSAVAMFVFLLSVGCPVYSGEITKIEPRIEHAVLAEKWNSIIELCGTNEDLIEQPVLRALKAHALLATNQNNDAHFLFLSVSKDPDNRIWEEWATEFSERFPGSHIAFYLLGDARARLGNWEKATEAFDKSLKIKPDFLLALHGRGVVYAYAEKWSESFKDLERVCEKDPSFAEGHASMGNFYLHRKAADGAHDCFNKALACCDDYALALNGRACAEYALVKWEEANEDFAAAGRAMPMPLFLVNLRALAVAVEKSQLPGMDNSPLFRVTDFLDWDALRDSTSKEDDVMRAALGGKGLPEGIDTGIIEELNETLKNASLYSLVKDRVPLEEASPRLIALIEDTEACRNKNPNDITDEEKANIVVLNRLIYELEYPYLIAQHEQRDPGTQLTLTQGRVNAFDYKMSLGADQIVMGQARIDQLWKPMADVMQSIPLISGLGRAYDRHLEYSTFTNQMAMDQKWGLSLNDFRPGGVLADLRRAHVDKGDWPVTNWFGMAYVTKD